MATYCDKRLTKTIYDEVIDNNNRRLNKMSLIGIGCRTKDRRYYLMFLN